MAQLTHGRLPDFIIIGAAKSGTTTLASYLARHPNIFCEHKEPCFFDDDVAWNQGWDWYSSLFANAKPGQLCFEASTNYSRFPQVKHVPERMYARLPHLKLIYIVRHPVDRAFSHYVHRHMRELYPGQPFIPFEEFIEKDPMCIDSSNYMLQIEQYLKYFPPQSLLLLRLEDLQHDAEGTVKNVLRFVGADDNISVANDAIVENAATPLVEHALRNNLMQALRNHPVLSRVKRFVPERMRDFVFEMMKRTRRGRHMSTALAPKPMLPETRAALLEMFVEPNRALSQQFGVDTSTWDR